ncbi:hypothetical protein CEXT_626981 [Caerostris extrusa]|uniref:Rap-GAP domain-containing protein n=1 Tax=Caerostris extrusa TaxID=172846 RepID=A0AAV4PUS2_CAEEX|nr:hypothetical protein CEXT_626981 [Caerostris extrusa]
MIILSIPEDRTQSGSNPYQRRTVYGRTNFGQPKNTPLFDEFLSVLGEKNSFKRNPPPSFIDRPASKVSNPSILQKGNNGSQLSGSFDKYKGGLDSVHDLTGKEAVYTTWRGIEMMFHVSTLLPHEEYDPQKKKRHIGNDIVCVVFLEGEDTLFSPVCIKSHFLHTFIVVRCNPTLQASLPVYEVAVVSRDEVGAYKPYLWHRSRFTKDTLFREWILTKIVNGERASYSAPKFARMQVKINT